MPVRLIEWEEILSRILDPGGSPTKPLWTVHCYEQLTSTMDEARRLVAELSLNNPALVLARWQSSGRGRQGRTWQSAEGALFATFVFGTTRSAVELSPFSLVTGCVLAEIFRSLSCEVGLKWPNDILAEDGRKLCGVLLELIPCEEINFILLGIGVNLIATPAAVAGSISLRELCGRNYEPVELAAPLALRLHQEWLSYLESGFRPYRQRWLALAQYVGEEVVYDCGGEVLRGKVMGINDLGSLLLLDGEGNVREVIAGHMVG